MKGTTAVTWALNAADEGCETEPEWKRRSYDWNGQQKKKKSHSLLLAGKKKHWMSCMFSSGLHDNRGRQCSFSSLDPCVWENIRLCTHVTRTPTSNTRSGSCLPRRAAAGCQSWERSHQRKSNLTVLLSYFSPLCASEIVAVSYHAGSVLLQQLWGKNWKFDILM